MYAATPHGGGAPQDLDKDNCVDNALGKALQGLTSPGQTSSLRSSQI
jgi:hypothetical protein